MERIGLVASKIAKGNLFLYNAFVILVTMLFSLLVFFIAGSTVVIVLILVAVVSSSFSMPDLQQGWMTLMYYCLLCVSGFIGFFALCALIKNLKFRK